MFCCFYKSRRIWREGVVCCLQDLNGQMELAQATTRCTLFCGMNTKCLNFADNFIELTGAYLLPGRPWDERLSRYYRCRHAQMMRYGQSYTHRWGGEWSAGLHLMEVGTKRPLVIDYVENWRKSLSRMDSSLQSFPSPHFYPHLCTSGHRSPEMDGQSV